MPPLKPVGELPYLPIPSFWWFAGNSWCSLFYSCNISFSPRMSSCKDTTHDGLRSTLNEYDFILTLYQQLPYFQIRSHSAVLQFRTSIYFWGDTIQSYTNSMRKQGRREHVPTYCEASITLNTKPEFSLLELKCFFINSDHQRRAMPILEVCALGDGEGQGQTKTDI